MTAASPHNCSRAPPTSSSATMAAGPRRGARRSCPPQCRASGGCWHGLSGMRVRLPRLRERAPDHTGPRLAGCSGHRLLQLELQVLHVGEPHLFQAAGAAAAVLEVHLLECFGRDFFEFAVAGAGFLGVEEAGCVLRG